MPNAILNPFSDLVGKQRTQAEQVFAKVPHFGNSDQSGQIELHSTNLLSNPWGEIHCQFRCSLTTFSGQIASHNSMGKKEDIVGNKTRHKKEWQRNEREPKGKIDSTFAKNVWLCAHAKKSAAQFRAQLYPVGRII